MKIALAYNLKEKDGARPADYFSEFDSQGTVDAIRQAISQNGHDVLGLDINKEDPFTYFRKNRPDMVFNIAEGALGKMRESQVPAILDQMKIPYTGSNSFSLALALNKALTKRVLKAEGIPTPAFQVFFKGNEGLRPDLKFPLIVKPNREGSAKGISISSVVYTKGALYRKVKETISGYRQEALVEEFIVGRELTVGILENGRVTVLPVLEIDFSDCAESGEYFYTWRMKEYQGDRNLGLLPAFHCPARLDKKTEERVKEAAIMTHRAVGCFDMSRTDIRLSSDNTAYVLEINPLPGLDPKESNFPFMAYAAGMKYDELIGAILLNASERIGLN